MDERVSVAIPCRNEREYIGACLASLVAADTAGTRLTVLVCDGMSDDGTRDIIQDWSRRHPFIRMVDNPARTTPQAMNLGLRAVPFDYGMILGAHAEVGADYISNCISALRVDPSLGCAGGLVENRYGNDVSRAIGAAMGHPFGVGGARFRTGGQEGSVDTVAFGVYRKEVFDRVGWFDEDLVRNQDDEFNYRVTSAGYPIRFLPTAKCVYHVRASFAKLFKQYRQYGYWKVYVNRKHRTVTTVRQMIPAAWMLFLIAGAFTAIALPWTRLLYLGGIGTYVLASVYAAFRAAPESKDVPGVLRAFWTLHAAYGWGYLQGLVVFLVLRRRPSEHSKRLTR
jgi:cellulose synthase/poly-beta-1,6-N-acetylglucosamine synthase-like glycosyltransferase